MYKRMRKVHWHKQVVKAHWETKETSELVEEDCRGVAEVSVEWNSGRSADNSIDSALECWAEVLCGIVDQKIEKFQKNAGLGVETKCESSFCCCCCCCSSSLLLPDLCAYLLAYLWV